MVFDYLANTPHSYFLSQSPLELGLVAVSSLPAATKKPDTVPASQSRRLTQSNFHQTLGLCQADVLFILQFWILGLSWFEIEHNLAECQLQLDDGKTKLSSSQLGASVKRSDRTCWLDLLLPDAIS